MCHLRRNMPPAWSMKARTPWGDKACSAFPPD